MTAERYPTTQVIQAIRKTKGLVSMAAEMLGCEPDTVRNYARRHPTVAAALREERSRMTDVAELALYNSIVAREPWAVSLYLKTIGQDRGYVERHEVTGKDGGEIVLRVVYDDEKLDFTPYRNNDNSRMVDGNRPALEAGLP